MTDFIERRTLLRALERTVYKTYYNEIVKKTPGRGIVADAWEVCIENDEVILKNEEYGNVVLYLDLGTKPHIIRAKPGKVLRWKVGPGDTYAFATKVHHPGIEATKFVTKILESPVMYKKFQKVLEHEIMKSMPKRLNI